MSKLLRALIGSALVLVGCIHGEPMGGPTEAPSATAPDPEPVFPVAPDASTAGVVNHLELHMDTDFDTDEREDIIAAAWAWRNQTGGLADITIVFDLEFDDLMGLQEHFNLRHNLVVRRFSDDELVKYADSTVGCTWGCVLGWMASEGGVIHGALVVDRFSTRNIQQLVIVHEFGHALGVAHVDDGGAIMYPSVHPGQTPCLTKSDLEAFCKANVCGTTLMTECK